MSGVWSESPYGDAESLAHRRHRAQVDELGRAGVVRGALHDEELASRASRSDRAQRARRPPSRTSRSRAARASRSRRSPRAAAGSSPRPRRSCTPGTPTSSSSSTASTENGEEKNTSPRSSANAFNRRWSSSESSIRFVNSQRGSSKCGGVGVEGSISASAMCVWNLTASAPASAAASISRSACRIDAVVVVADLGNGEDPRTELPSVDLHGGHCSGGRLRIRRSRLPRSSES